jgi:hypothetical protein
MNQETKAMQDILDRLNAASTKAPATSTVSNASARSTGSVSPAAVEMLSILTKLENAATTVASKLVTESTDVPESDLADKVGIGKYNVVLEKSSVAGFAKTFYTITENGKSVYQQLALFESAMAIIKVKLFNKNSDKINQIVDLDSKYASALHEAASHKSRMTHSPLNESQQDVLAAKHSNAIARMQGIKKQIKTLL